MAKKKTVAKKRTVQCTVCGSTDIHACIMGWVNNPADIVWEGDPGGDVREGAKLEDTLVHYLHCVNCNADAEVEEIKEKAAA